MDDEFSKKNFQNLLLEYFKQGFLFSSYAINGEWEPTSNVTDEKALKSELQYFIDYIKSGFKSYIQKNWKEQVLTLLKVKDSIKKDVIREKILVKIDEKRRLKENTPENGKEKPIAECQLCKRKIYLSELELDNIDISSIQTFPFSYIHVHSSNGNQPHALLMYLDRELKVRGRKPSDFLKIQDK